MLGKGSGAIGGEREERWDGGNECWERERDESGDGTEKRGTGGVL